MGRSKWSSSQCYFNKKIRFKTPMLRSDLCDYSDVHILVKGKMFKALVTITEDIKS